MDKGNMSIRSLGFAGALSVLALVDVRAEQVRIATFNVSMNRDLPGRLVEELTAGQSAQARAVAAIIQQVRPDILLLNEFDYDPAGAALAAFQEGFLEVGQYGRAPINFANAALFPSNTGVDTGLDLDRDGMLAGPGDAQGYGAFPGQYGFVLLSQAPFRGDWRSFQNFLWSDMPGALLPDNPATGAPDDYYSPDSIAVVRVSSKNHVDVPVSVGGVVFSLLLSHPTPPAFDGPERRNWNRNHDEIRLWIDYVSGDAGYLVDDAGLSGDQIAFDGPFVILGDLNLDPGDGNGWRDDFVAFLGSGLVVDPRPRSKGGEAASAAQGGANSRHGGDPTADTADFRDDPGPGNLRVDYVLPSRHFRVVDSGVFWPAPDEDGHELIGAGGRVSSDHRLVWVDVEIGD